MVDIVDKKTRSEMMSRIRSKDTKPELIVRSMLHQLGLRFRLHQKVEGCKPDIVLAKHRTVIFVHGCFWHRHLNCKYAYTPKSRVEFWQNKFEENRARDTRNRKSLQKAGWRVLVLWECETQNPDKLKKKLKQVFEIPCPKNSRKTN